MSRLLRILIALCLPTLAAAQGVRYDSYNMTSANNVPFGAQAPIYTLPNSTVTVCAYPDDGGQPCGNVIPIYSDPALTQTADNPITADVHGRFGFWLASGTYTYSVVTQGGVFIGTYIFTLGGSGGSTGCATGGALTPDGQMIYNAAGDCASSPNIFVPSPTTSQNPVGASNEIEIKNFVGTSTDDQINLDLESAVSSSTNNSRFSPHLWQMNCTNSGRTGLGCQIALTVNDLGRTDPTTGGLTPILINMEEDKAGSHSHFAGVEIDQILSPGIVTSASAAGILYQGPFNRSSTFGNVYFLEGHMDGGGVATGVERGIYLTTTAGNTIGANYCDFIASDSNDANVRESLGCGPTSVSTFAGPVVLPLYTPASSSAACTAGQIADDAGFHYVCVATNTWKRVALSSF